MKLKFLFILMITFNTAMAQIEAVPATLNQVHPDPAQKSVESEVNKLRKTVEDLDSPDHNKKNPQHKDKKDLPKKPSSKSIQ